MLPHFIACVVRRWGISLVTVMSLGLEGTTKFQNQNMQLKNHVKDWGFGLLFRQVFFFFL